MAFVAKINGQVVEVNSIAELSWLGCMISPGTNGNNNGNNNGNIHTHTTRESREGQLIQVVSKKASLRPAINEAAESAGL